MMRLVTVSSTLRATYVDGDGVERSAPLDSIDARQVADGLPVRMPPSYVGQRHYPGHFWSSTMGRHVVYESLLERDWLWTADFDPSVVRIAAQPILIEGFDGAAKRTRFPDFMCLAVDGRVHVVDVKAPQALSKPEVTTALDWTRRVIEERGWSYEVWTGASRTVLRNIQMIAAGRLSWVCDEQSLEVVVREARSTTTIEELERRLLSQPDLTSLPRLAILAALWKGRLRCDMTVPLARSSWIGVA
ncbi:TnsA-like heteromeric transposase endonuclease subunit [Isoptericola jiangsuensis]|uniref:TnsA-like heteromeric transposase endonuclease subunit n=1 Tax=Isoptericola jiangsuensis TaxID=548579 RepID=UPI003AAE2DFF